MGRYVAPPAHSRLPDSVHHKERCRQLLVYQLLDRSDRYGIEESADHRAYRSEQERLPDHLYPLYPLPGSTPLRRMGWFHELQNDNQIYQSPFRKHLSRPQAAPRRRPISAALLIFFLPGGLRDREGSQRQVRRAPQPTPHNLFL